MIKSAFCILVLKWLNHSKPDYFLQFNFLRIGGLFFRFLNGCCLVFKWHLITGQFDNHDLTIQISDMSGIRIPTVSFKKHISCAQKWSIYNLIYVILQTNLRRAKIVNFQFWIVFYLHHFVQKLDNTFFYLQIYLKTFWQQLFCTIKSSRMIRK